MPIVLRTTTRRESNPKIPLDLEGFLADDALSSTLGVGDSAVAAALFAFFVEGVEGTSMVVVLLEVDPASLGPSEASGSVGSIYVSNSVERATDEATHTTGVRVSIRRTITPAK